MADEPFSDSISTDIVLLSSYLSLEKKPRPSVFQKLEASEPPLLKCLSTLLNIGSHPLSSVNAVVGHSDARSIHCIVFSETTGCSSDELDTSIKFQGPQSCSLQPIKPDVKRGADILKNWEYDNSDCTLEMHLQDICNILSHMRLASNRAQDLGNFVFLIHRRAFRELARWVRMFSDQWGMLPFDILENCLDVILECPVLWTCSFTLKLEDIEYSLVKEFVDADMISVENPQTYKFSFNASNIRSWIMLFKHIWSQLEEKLIEPSVLSQSNVSTTTRKVISTAPNKLSTQTITLLIATLHALRHVLKHLLSLPVAKYHQDLMAADQGSELREINESSAVHALRLLHMVTRYYASTISLWHHFTRFFDDKMIYIEQFRSDITGLFECSDREVTAFLNAILPHLPDPQAIAQLQRTARYATLHAEAALIGYAYHEPSNEIFSSAIKLPVCTDNKCCQLCWWLKEGLEQVSNKTYLAFPGRHSMFLPWIPPFGVPDHALRMLRHRLLNEVVHNRFDTHTTDQLRRTIMYTALSP